MRNLLKIVIAMSVCMSVACGGRSAVKNTVSSVEPVVVEGLAIYNGGDPAAASGAALGEAQKNAVTAVAELFVDPSAKAERSEAYRQSLLKNPQAYVKKYKVLSQGAEGGFYKVRIRAYVQTDKVSAVLKGLSLAARPAGARSAILRADEYFNSRPSSGGDFARAFTEYFKGRDAVTFTDPSAAASQPAEGAGARLWADAESGAAELNAVFDAARMAGAGLIIMGRAEAFPLSAAQGSQVGFYPARAEARLKIFDVDTRKILLELSSQSNALAPSEDESFKRALAAVGELLAQETMGGLDKIKTPRTQVTLRVKGLSGIEEAAKLRESVSRLDIANAVFESYSEGTAVMTLALKKPDPQEFASVLLRAGVFNMYLESVTQFEIVFVVIR